MLTLNMKNSKQVGYDLRFSKYIWFVAIKIVNNRKYILSFEIFDVRFAVPLTRAYFCIENCSHIKIFQQNESIRRQPVIATLSQQNFNLNKKTL